MAFLWVNEGYVGGESFFESPMATYVDDPYITRALTWRCGRRRDGSPRYGRPIRVRWRAVDDRTALLFMPFESQTENFVVRFNPETGLIDSMEAMRYRDPGPG